jgi:hypothetical protein
MDRGIDSRLGIKVARWYTFKPKIPIWVRYVGSFNGRCWYILCPFDQSCGHFGVFYGHLEYIFRFGMFYQEKSEAHS